MAKAPATVTESRAPQPDARFERRMTFAEHLDELRGNVLRSVAVLVGLMVLGYVFHPYVESFVRGPYETVRENLRLEPTVATLDEVKEPFQARYRPATTVDNAQGGFVLVGDGHVLPPLSGYDMAEAFLFTLQVVLYTALLLGAPYFLFEMWRFISAGLYAHERRAVMRILPVSLGLFFVGGAFSYLVLVPISVEFMMTWSEQDVVKIEPRLDSYLTFFVILTLMLGVVFQLPLVQVVLARFGILPAAKQAAWRRGFIMTAVIVAAVITPTGDPITLSLVAIPMVVLYEIGILIGRRVKPRAAAHQG